MTHYFDEQPTAGHQERQVLVRVCGLDFQFTTDQAVFSRTRLDFGSELLITATAPEKETPVGRLLDLGCGYGAVGIIMKRLFPALEVVLCDINSRAVILAKDNAAANQARFVEVVQSDGLQAVEGRFDLIMTNPPIRAGKATVYRFFSESAARLRSGGRLYMVIRKKQGASSALDRLKRLFSRVEVIKKSAGYWIIRAQNPIDSTSVPSPKTETTKMEENKTCTNNQGNAHQEMKPSILEPHVLSQIRSVVGVYSGKGGGGKSMVTSLLERKPQ